jgi:hypothetical protein
MVGAVRPGVAERDWAWLHARNWPFAGALRPAPRADFGWAVGVAVGMAPPAPPRLAPPRPASGRVRPRRR